MVSSNLFEIGILLVLKYTFSIYSAEGSASTDYDLFEYGIFKVGLRKGFNNAKSAMLVPKRIFYHPQKGFFFLFDETFLKIKQ